MFEFNEKVNNGYRLLDKGSGLWLIQAPDGNYSGTLKQVCLFAVHEYGFDIAELEFGVMEMEKKWHNAAEYGMFKSFMFTHDDQEKERSTKNN